MLVVRGPTYLCEIPFVGLFFVDLPLLFLILRTSAVLQTIRDPNHDVFLVRKELCNRLVIDVVRAL